MTLLAKAKKLRQQNTPTEIKLWNHIRSRRFMGLKFRRQYPLGPYIVDFICIEKKLIIEIDGSQHNELKQEAYDAHRTEYLTKLGYQVLRFWNHEILLHFDEVTDKLYQHMFSID